MPWMPILFLILVCGFCNSQGFSSCNETATDCIGEYTDLEMHITNNTALMEKLAGTFYVTGKATSKFVKITYNFQTSSNNMQSIQDNVTNCCITYVWSETALYLLGPKMMKYLTLFAVNIDEVDVTIELPCLCNDVYNSLLSRLTYLVCIYIYN